MRSSGKLSVFMGHTQPVIQKLIEKSKDALVGRHIASAEQAHAQPQEQLPPALANAHPQLAHAAAEAIIASARPIPLWDLGSAGEERFAGAADIPTPFIPVPPRVTENQIFNFDHGALSAGLVDETSYMTWF